MTDPIILEVIAKANATIQSWPEWKKNLLVESSKPSNPTPREPVKASSLGEQSENQSVK
ncbi:MULTISPECIES: hypothetical protein [Pirellulaceae]|uniref:hypothetical protein n=1 Tax=Pirellulaceae TaxID=2691357 RepID=UPI001304F26D|nr:MULTISPECIES: hypothetical protein [Pirellulaceae]